MATRQDPTQNQLFEVHDDGTTVPLTAPQPLTAASTLAAAISTWEVAMTNKGLSPHTIKAFRGDLNLLARYHGRSKAIGQLGTSELHDFLTYLREGRGVPCSPKSYQRRLTSIKSFFKWLNDFGVLERDPAAPLLHMPVRVPMPEILYDDEVAALLTTAEAIRHAAEKPDARPYLLLTLLLKTGIKKSEAVGIALDHMDFSRPDEPVVYIRYSNPRMAHKERKLALPDDFAAAFDEYRDQHEPREKLFECTPRNLEYVLQRLGEAAGLRKQPSFEMLRTTAAVRDLQRGVDSDTVRRKLGLSEITWRDTGARIAQLAAPAL